MHSESRLIGSWASHIFIALMIASTAYAKDVTYELTVTQGSVNLSGKQPVDFALLINGSTPAPALEFTEGDNAVVKVRNQLQEEVSIHWHGLLVPTEMDGVPYVTTPPILAGQSYTFRWKVRQHGTYWYHSHTKLQEQKGLYGGIIIHPKDKTIKYDKDLVVVLSDWSDENADQIMANLRKDGDYYQHKKHSVRSIWGAFKAGGLRNYFGNEWERMGGMDLSDVGYDAFLMNGKANSQLYIGEPGQKVRIRVINAAASTYFHLALGNEPMTVISADGVDIEPTQAKEILIGMAETYDLLFEIPKSKNTELKATAQDVTGYASGWIGAGDRKGAPNKEPPDLYTAMNHDQHLNHMDHTNHGAHDISHADDTHADHSSHESANSHEDHTNHNGHDSEDSDDDHSGHHGHDGPDDESIDLPQVDTLTVDGLKATHSTAFASNKSAYELKLILGGDMERYVWHINGKAIHEDRTIEVREGDIVRFTFQNDTMMHHPMHLHGHFFRVLTEAQDRSPLKHTVDVPPHGSRTIEFMANEPGEWMLHCHNLYHMKTGMSRIVKYTSYNPRPEIAMHQRHDPHRHDHIYAATAIDLGTTYAQAKVRAQRTWDALDLDASIDDYLDRHSFESRVVYRRWISDYFTLLTGLRFQNSESTKEGPRAVIGASYKLPLRIESELWIDHRGVYALDLEKKLQWTSEFFTNLEATFGRSSKPGYGASIMYGPSWSWAAGIVYHKKDFGALIQLRF